MIRAMQQVFRTPAPRLPLVLHYVIARAEGADFGRVKINKAVVRSDVEHFRRYGTTITGASSFQKQQFGPVPNGVLKALKSLEAEGKIAHRRVSTPVGEREEYVALEEPDISKFSAAEIDVVHLALSQLRHLSALEASERTHDALWDEVEPFGQIPVKAAAFAPSAIDEDTLAWALSNKH